MSIVIENLSMSYGDVLAVNDFSLEVHDGEMLVLLGPSGCGKTTTMRCIAGLESPQAGRIVVSGETMYDAYNRVNVDTNKRRIGMVFQSYAIWPHMTVFDNLAFPLKMQKVPRADIKQRVHEVLEMVGLQDYADRGASRLSGGQMQRVAVARSVVMRPRVLLFDEPLSNLDAKLRDKLRFELREIQQELNITSLYVTHDQDEALALADRIAVMKDGVAAQVGSPFSMYRSPASTFVADFLGMDNIFEGSLRGHEEGDVYSIALEDDLVVSGADRTGQFAADSAPGSRVFACIRPEAVQLSSSPLPSTRNTWKAQVGVASFLGDHARYRVRLDDGISLYVTTDVPDEMFEVGQDIHCHVPPDAVILLRE